MALDILGSASGIGQFTDIVSFSMSLEMTPLVTTWHADLQLVVLRIISV